MNFELHSSRISVSESTRSYVERRLAFAIGRFADVVRNIAVRLEDVNGPRGGVDKLCRIRVKLAGERNPVIAEVVDVEIRSAIDIAAERAGRTVARQLDRKTRRRTGERAGSFIPAMYGDRMHA